MTSEDLMKFKAKIAEAKLKKEILKEKKAWKKAGTSFMQHKIKAIGKLRPVKRATIIIK